MGGLYVFVDVGLHFGCLHAVVALPLTVDLAHFGVDNRFKI